MSDRGSASVWLVGLAGLVLLASAAGVVRGAAVVVRHRVEAAADLAALAAAARLADGSGGDPCAAASQVAAANGAVLSGCRLAGSTAEVEAEATLDAGLLGRHRARARARAGPATGAAAPG